MPKVVDKKADAKKSTRLQLVKTPVGKKNVKVDLRDRVEVTVSENHPMVKRTDHPLKAGDKQVIHPHLAAHYDQLGYLQEYIPPVHEDEEGEEKETDLNDDDF